MRKLINIFKPAPFIETMADEEQVKKSYKYWRIRTFYAMYIGYVFYYFTRKSFIFAMPALIADLGFSITDLGILASILSITYGVSKFASGILGDRSNPRYIMSFGLIITGFINIFFGMSSSIYAFAIFWGLNGWFQGFGWPPACRLLTHWYSQKERGTWWSLWSTSHNVGGAIIPLLVAFCVLHYGWRYAMYVPGVLCIVVGLFIMNRLRDTPQSLGLPSIENFKDDHVKGEARDKKEREFTVKEILFKYILKNKIIWMLGISYFFVYIVRQGVNDWSAMFLIDTKGYKEVSANLTITAFEIGGFFGMLVAGFASDYIFKGRRVPVMVLYMVAILIPFLGLIMIKTTAVTLDIILLGAIGFFIFGPQMLIGCTAADFSHKKAAATATGFVGCFAYIGAAVAGYPLTYIIKL